MSLNNPQSRLAFGTLFQAAVIIASIGLLAWSIKLLENDSRDIAHIALFLCAIVCLSVAGGIARDVGKVNLSIGKDGVQEDIGGGGAP